MINIIRDQKWLIVIMIVWVVVRLVTILVLKYKKRRNGGTEHE